MAAYNARDPYNNPTLDDDDLIDPDDGALQMRKYSLDWFWMME